MRHWVRQISTGIGYCGLELLVLIGCLRISEWLWSRLLVRSDGTSPGDAFGYAAILLIAGPFWIMVATISPMLAHAVAPPPGRRPQRVGLSILLPVLAAVCSTVLLTLISEAL